jgi:hypothetical protein
MCATWGEFRFGCRSEGVRVERAAVGVELREPGWVGDAIGGGVGPRADVAGRDRGVDGAQLGEGGRLVRRNDEGGAGSACRPRAAVGGRDRASGGTAFAPLALSTWTLSLSTPARSRAASI